jgi:transposase
MTNGTPSQHTDSKTILYMAMELSAQTWMLAFGDGGARKARRRTIDAGDLEALGREVQLAKEKLGMSASSEVVSCYEAGRDGFWIDRALIARGVTNHIVESASIEVNRRQRRAKTDAIDVEALLRLLVRFHRGDHNVWRTVRVPSEEDEDVRRLHRERERLQKEVTQLRNRTFGLLATEGLRCEPTELLKFLKEARTRDGRELGPALAAELKRMHERLTLLCTQLKAVEKEQGESVRQPHAGDDRMTKITRLMCLRGIGLQGAWLMVMEFFGWRQFRNRREVGALAGLTGTPFNSGGSEREQGISKAGNKRVRHMAVELAWLWIRHQPASALTTWFLERFGKTGARSRKVGIVALARKLLVALWHFVDHGVIPDGAVLSPSRGIAAATFADTRAACRAARCSSTRLEATEIAAPA